MKEAPFPPDEAARVRSLREYDILDTLPEQAYDDITFVASRICDTPIALVSLVDSDRQWFKSRVGLDATETPRSLAFCAHALLAPRELFIVEDATEDHRFADNPLVAGKPNIRFYAGAPLISSDGHALGTLCVIDRRARELDEAQVQTLRALARQVVAQLELRRSVAQLEENSQVMQRNHAILEKRTNQLVRSRNQLSDLCGMLERQADVIERDLHRAEIIQRSLLPQAPPCVNGYCVQSLYRPGRNIGGDLYDVVAIDDRHVALVIADASGHGVSAAMLSVLFNHRLSLVDDQTGEPHRPARALALVNAALRRDVSAPGVFVTAALCILDTEERTVTIASAGHPPVLWMKAAGGCERIEHTGPALGLAAGAQFSEHEIRLDSGDRLLLYTDGLFDVDANASLDLISETLQQVGRDQDALEKVLLRVSDGQEREDRDDVTMLLLDASPGESRFRETHEALGLKATLKPDIPAITYAEAEAATVICLRGRVTWTLGQALLEAAVAVIESGRSLVLDFDGCEYFDSTLLGTLHESVERAGEHNVPLRLQHVSNSIRAAFEELSMRAVLAHISDDPLPVPTNRTPLALPAADVTRQQLRLLKAHEILRNLSDDNQQQFEGIVEALRADIENP